MLDLFDLVLLGVAAFFVVRVIDEYRKIKKEPKETDPDGE